MKLRLFFGIRLPAALSAELAAYSAMLRISAVGGELAWVPEENFHVTLKFLGGVEEGRFSGIAERARDVFSSAAPVELALGRPGGSRSVLWLDVEDPSRRLRELAARLDHELEALGFAPEKRGFHPHLTLARIKRGGRPREPLALVPPPSGAFQASSAVLFRSETLATGARYQGLLEFPFGGGG